MQTLKFLDTNWKRWVAENVLRGGRAEDLTRILVENGFPENIASLEVDTAFAHPYLAAGASVVRQLAKRDWVLHNSRILIEASSSQVTEVWDSIDPLVFAEQFYCTNRPLVIRGGAAKMVAMAKWNPDYLKEIAGTENVEIQGDRESDPDFEINSTQHSRSCNFGDLVDKTFSDAATNDFYLTANNANSNSRALASFWPDVRPLPAFLDESNIDGRMFFWMGPAGTVTPLHHDLTNNLMIQIRGRKRVKLIAPSYLPYVYNHLHCYSRVDPENVDLNRFPLFRNARVIDVTIGPGDILFLPVGWWHHVRGLDATITITCTNFRGVNLFTEHYHTYQQI